MTATPSAKPQAAAAAARAGLSISALAQKVGGEVYGRGDVIVSGINAIDSAEPGDLTFMTSAQFIPAFATSRAAAAVISKRLLPSDELQAARPLIIVPDADIAVALLLPLFAPPPALPASGLHPTAWADPTASIGCEVRIGPHVSIGPGAAIGDGVVLHAGVRIYDHVRVGEQSVLHSNVVVRERCEIGRRALIHQNVSIGADGFGFRPAPDFKSIIKVPQIGNVVIGDDVEIGANTCIDRGKFGSTVIGAGTKLDNLIQIAHNVRIGRCCLIAGCVGIGGSVTIGDWVMIGGASTFKEHLTIGDRARVGAGSLVMRDVAAGEAVLGHPADIHRQALRQWASTRKLPGLLARLQDKEVSGQQSAVGDDQ